MTDIRNLIKQVMAQGLTDPQDIAKHAALAVPTRERLEILTEVLTSYVRTHFGQERQQVGGTNSFLASLPDSEKSTPKTVAPNRSAKKASWIAHHEEMLRQEARGLAGYKRIGDFTVEDFVYAADMRQSKAEGLRRSADDYRNAAELMRKYHAATFKDLPDEALKQVELPDDDSDL